MGFKIYSENMRWRNSNLSDLLHVSSFREHFLIAITENEIDSGVENVEFMGTGKYIVVHCDRDRGNTGFSRVG